MARPSAETRAEYRAGQGRVGVMRGPRRKLFYAKISLIFVEVFGS